MDIHYFLALAREFLVLILVFGALLAYAIVRGKRALIALILGLYLALLISLKFPYYETLSALTARDGAPAPLATILIFALFTGISAFLFERLLSEEYRETAFEGISKKVILAALGAILILAYSYHVLPITNIIDPGTTISTLFAPREYFFWLIIVPLVGLFFV